MASTDKHGTGEDVDYKSAAFTTDTVAPALTNDAYAARVSRMPDSLKDLSEEEIAKLNKKLTRKLDLIIL